MNKSLPKMSLLKGKKREPLKRKSRWCAFDSETDGFDGAVKFGTYALETHDEDYPVYAGYFESWYEFFNHIQANREEYHDVIFIAHNLGYDIGRAYNVILDYIQEGHTFSLIESGENNIIGFTWNNSQGEPIATFHDSLALFPRSLKDFTSSFAVPHLVKQSGAIDFETETPDIENPTHLEYGIIDSLGLLSALQNFDKMLYECFGVHARLTAASTAMQAWRVTLDKNFSIARLAPEIEDFCRKCYYGGFVGIGRHAAKINKNAKHFDISSSYPASMLQIGAPFGKPLKTWKENLGYFGVYRVKVNVPRETLPVVPLKTKNGLRWPYGEFETYITSIDIENARNWGIDVEVIEGYYWQKSENPFTTFVDICRSLRKRFKKQPPEDIAKLMQNSLYGKFAMKAEGTKIVLTLNPETEEVFMSHNSVFDHYRDVKPETREAAYMLPHWAAFITANSRLNLHSFIKDIGLENYLYSDTDSVIVANEGVDNINPDKIGSEYGNWQHENDYSRVKILAPKVYVGELSKPDKNGNKYKGRAKGIPRRLATQNLLETMLLSDKNITESFYYDSISSLASIIKGGELVVKRNRKLSSIDTSSNWILVDGLVYPKHCKEK